MRKLLVSLFLALIFLAGFAMAGEHGRPERKRGHRIRVKVLNVVNLPAPQVDVNIFGPAGDPGLLRSEAWLEERRQEALKGRLIEYVNRLDVAEMKARQNRWHIKSNPTSNLVSPKALLDRAWRAFDNIGNVRLYIDRLFLAFGGGQDPRLYGDCWLAFWDASNRVRGALWKAKTYRGGEAKAQERIASNALWEAETAARGFSCGG